MASAILTKKQIRVIADDLANMSTSLTEYADDIHAGILPAKPYGVDEGVFAGQYPHHPLASPNLQQRVNLATRLRDTARAQRQPFSQPVLISLHDALFDCAEQVRRLIIETLFYGGGAQSEVALNTLWALRKEMGLWNKNLLEDRYLRAASERFSPPVLKTAILSSYRFIQMLGGSIELVIGLHSLGDTEGVVVLQEHDFGVLCKADRRTLLQIIDRRALQTIMDNTLIASMERVGFPVLPRHATVILLTEGSSDAETTLAPKRWAITRPADSPWFGVFYGALMGRR